MKWGLCFQWVYYQGGVWFWGCRWCMQSRESHTLKGRTVQRPSRRKTSEVLTAGHASESIVHGRIKKHLVHQLKIGSRGLQTLFWGNILLSLIWLHTQLATFSLQSILPGLGKRILPLRQMYSLLSKGRKIPHYRQQGCLSVAWGFPQGR